VEAAGYAVDYVSPKGGYTPIDPHSLAMAEPVDWEWYQNKAFMNRLGANLSPGEIKASDYCCIYYAVGLLNIKLSDGTLLIKGKRMTGISNQEEKLAELDKYVPYFTEDELKVRARPMKRPPNRGSPLRLKIGA